MEESSVNVVHAIERALTSGPIRIRLPKPKVLERIIPNQEKLTEVAHESHQILFKANTVFPFNLFPDTVTIDREKLTIADRLFFRVAKIISVPIRDILNVEASVGPFFGAVHMTSRYYPVNPYSVNFLWRSDAIKLQRLLQGYIIAHERGIDCADIAKKPLISLLNDLGSGDTS